MTPFPAHTATLSISTKAICRNWARLDALSDARFQTGAVIKANAYGLGMVPVSLALYEAGCRLFYTARLHEAITLSQAFAEASHQQAKIIVFDGMMAGQEEAFIAHKLTPVINDEAQLIRAKALAADKRAPLEVIIHIDTAMARLGLSPQSWQNIMSQKGWDDGLSLMMVMSHLASADDVTAQQNQLQLALFKELTDTVSAPLSLANSGGILLGSDFHFQATRPGLSLFGLSLFGLPQFDARPTDAPLELESAIRLEADILQIRDVSKGATVGYGASFIAPCAMRLATLGIGYADGLLHQYQPHIMPRINGKACAMLGRISMDSCVIDVSHLSEEELANAKSATLFDEAFTPQDLAHKTGTISYEVMTTLGERLLRLYDEAGS